MKKYIVLFSILCLLGLSACGQVETKKIELVKDEKYLNQLSKEAFDADFILDEVYYKLPCEFKQFIDNGWEYKFGNHEINKYELSTVTLKPQEQITITLNKDNVTIDVRIINETNKDMKLSEKSMVGYISISSTAGKKMNFITKCGIRHGVSGEDVEAVLKDCEGYFQFVPNAMIEKDDRRYLYVDVMSETKTVISLTLSIYQHKNVVNYQKYETDTVKNEELQTKIKDFKKQSEQKAQEYPITKYSDFVRALQKKGRPGMYYGKFIIEGAIVIGDKTITSTLLNQKSGYLIKDELGNRYALRFSNGKKEMTVGNEIEIWSSLILSDDAVVEDEDGSKIPLLIPEIMQLNGEEFYNSFISE